MLFTLNFASVMFAKRKTWLVAALLPVLLLGLVSYSGRENSKQLPETIEELGQQLFFDRILSKDYTISCASCHNPTFAFADSAPFSKGVGGLKGNRNTPSAMNMNDRNSFFWDGRSATLEEQALEPIKNPIEMNLPIEAAVKRLKANTYYRAAFEKFFPESGVTPSNLGKAIAAFERTLETHKTPFDRWMEGDTTAISISAQRGHKLFLEKGKCFDCHFGPDFTGDEFRNIGLYNGKEYADAGRFEITKDSSDLGKFKTPGLRNVALTAPYMHDGSFATLREVIEYYNTPGKFVHGSINADSLIVDLHLTETEVADIENFLHSLTETQSLSRFSVRK